MNAHGDKERVFTADEIKAHLHLMSQYPDPLDRERYWIFRQVYDRLVAAESPLSSDERSGPWLKLYERMTNCAAGLTNYVEDRPELRRIEKEMEGIEAEARALKGKT